MCGIIGYVGEREVHEVLIKALSRLEYRGYDSAGIASFNGKGLTVLKERGKLSALKKMVAHGAASSHLGIGHTRWATHGEPSKKNAHPHADCTAQIAIVHNGIIENHEALRTSLKNEGHKLRSETDTEILAHLVEKFHIQEGATLEEAVRKTIEVIKGSYAFCAISLKEKDQFIAARNGSPLVVGVGEGENFVASDAPAILE